MIQPRQLVLSTSKSFMRAKPKELVAKIEAVGQAYKHAVIVPPSFPKAYKTMPSSVPSKTDKGKKPNGVHRFPQRIDQGQSSQLI